jgi:hypothetical protein
MYSLRSALVFIDTKVHEQQGNENDFGQFWQMIFVSKITA